MEELLPVDKSRFCLSDLNLSRRLSMVRCSTPLAFIFAAQWLMSLLLCSRALARSRISWLILWPGCACTMIELIKVVVMRLRICILERTNELFIAWKMVYFDTISRIFEENSYIYTQEHSACVRNNSCEVGEAPNWQLHFRRIPITKRSSPNDKIHRTTTIDPLCLDLGDARRPGGVMNLGISISNSCSIRHSPLLDFAPIILQT